MFGQPGDGDAPPRIIALLVVAAIVIGIGLGLWLFRVMT